MHLLHLIKMSKCPLKPPYPLLEPLKLKLLQIVKRDVICFITSTILEQDLRELQNSAFLFAEMGFGPS
jgi:hypothetical protein